MMTSEELKAIELTAQLWNLLVKLPDPHPCDNQEFMRDIHDIQNRIMARVTRRAYPEVFR